MALGVESGLRNVVEDTSPQLGGDWDVNGFSIISIANGNIVIEPNGTGITILNGKTSLQVSGTDYERLNIGGNLGFDMVAEITTSQKDAIVLTEDTGGTLAAGEYHYDVVFVTEEGSSESISAIFGTAQIPDITVAANAKVIVTGIPISSDPRVIARTIYRTINPGDVGYIAATILTVNDNSTTTWTDDGSLTPSGPINFAKSNSTAGAIMIANELAFKSNKSNLAVGYQALQSNNGYTNCAVGPSAGKNVSTGSDLTLIGNGAGKDVTTGRTNTLVGANAGINLSTGFHNTWIGASAYPAPGGSDTNFNTYLGKDAGWYGPHFAWHHNNTGIGSGAGRYCGGYANVFLGYRTGYLSSQTTDNNWNVIIGAESGQNLDGATYSIIIGSKIDLDDPTGDYQLNIGDLIKGSMDGKTLELDAALTLLERGADPAEPSEGECVLWMSDGTSSQTGVADGDVAIASKVGSVTKVTIIHDHSIAGAWI